MEPDSPWQLILLLVLLGFSAFFSASETSLTSLSRMRLRSMLDENVKGADVVEKLTANMKKLLSTILIGNNLVNVAASSLATAIAISLAGNQGTALVVATIVITVLILLFGEITPKTIAAQNNEKFAVLLARPIGFFVWLFTPVNMVINTATGAMLSLIGFQSDGSAPLITEAELKTIVNVSHEQGVLQVGERQMINNVFDFGDYDAKDVMTPRTDMVAVPYGAAFGDIVKVFEEERFTRLPVYKESTDHIIGILHLKDVAFYQDDGRAFDMDKYIRPAFFTYESKPTRELFAVMRTKRIPVAIVLDEYGGTSGLLTIEDLVEEIVGDISDEYDDIEDEVVMVNEHEYIVDGATRISDVGERLGIAIESEDFDSIGGYVTGMLGRIPELGESVETGSIRFIVEVVDKNRVEKLRVHI